MNEHSDAPDAAFQFEHLTEYSPEAARQIQAIYDVSFPANQRKPFAMVEQSMQDGRYTVLVVNRNVGAEKEIVAFALMLGLRVSQAAYIEYLAVAEPLRRRGIGSLLLRSMVTFFSTTASAIIWEVDPPELEGDEQERQIQFYERLGAHLIEKSTVYGMPNFWQGSGLIPLRLMWFPLQYDHQQPTTSELITFITDIYETEYHWSGSIPVRDAIIASINNG